MKTQVKVYLGITVVALSALAVMMVLFVPQQGSVADAAWPYNQSIQCINGVAYYFDGGGNQMGVAPSGPSTCGASVKMLVNGQSNAGPNTGVYSNSTTFIVSWSSTGVSYCNTGNSTGPWGPYVVKGTSGSETVTITQAQLLRGYTVAIQCAVDSAHNMIVQDNVSVTIPPVTAVCNTNADCGTSGYVGSDFCSGNSVYKNYSSYTCNNPGTASAYCTQNTQAQFQNSCGSGQTCSNGFCSGSNPPPTSACNTNSDCGTSGYTGSSFCQGNGVFQNYTQYTCNNPGTASAYCSQNTQAQQQNTCGSNQTCSGGTCINTNSPNVDLKINGQDGTITVTPGQQITLSWTSAGVTRCDTGTTQLSPWASYISKPVSGTETFTVNQTGTYGIQCATSATANMSVQDSVGVIVSSPAACSTNSDCGTNGYVGSQFCQNNGIYQNFVTYTCNNPGTASAYCTQNTQAQQKSACLNGQTCNNGSCTTVNITCSQNSDCGTSGFVGSSFCQGNSIFRNFVAYTCNNPGTASSYCSSNTQAQQQNACGSNQTCSNGTCNTNTTPSIDLKANSQDGTITITKGQSVNLSWTSNDVLSCNSGTSPAPFGPYISKPTNGSETITPITSASYGIQCVAVGGNPNMTVQDSVGVVVNNPQPAACNQNSDCGTSGYIGSAFCSGNGIYKNYTTYTCNNPGTPLAYCSQNTQAQLESTCLNNQNCSGGTCVTSCTPHATQQCVGGSVHWFNSCGVDEGISQACTGNQICQNAQCITPACNQNSDCGTSGYTGSAFCSGNGVFQNYTQYTCNNPGTQSAYCTQNTQAQQKSVCQTGQACSNGTCGAVTCSQNSDCGTSGYTGSPTCQGNSVFQNYTTYTCNNPGTVNSTCTTNTQSQQKSICQAGQACNNGTCGNVACTQNSDCGNNGYVGSASCSGNNVIQNFITYTCNNPGTTSAFCTNSTQQQQKSVCPAGQACNNGSCGAVVCSQNSDCGTSGYVGSASCSGNNIVQNYTTYTCNNPGTTSAYCTNSTQQQQKSTCQTGQACNNGTCGAVTCSQNSDCGTSGYTGSPMCSGNNIVQNYTTYTCNNPGTSTSFCSTNVAQQQKSSCQTGQTCNNGTCNTVNITCSQNSDCGSNSYTGSAFCNGNAIFKNFITYTCNNPGTASSYCSSNTQAQQQNACGSNQTCSNGTCNNTNVGNIVCSQNSDCGSNTYTGSATCQGNAVYRNYTTYTCNNPGTTSSYCSNNTTNQFQHNCSNGQTCQNGSCGNNCTQNASQRCVGNAVYWFDSCGNQQGVSQQCLSNQTCSNNTCVNQTAGNVTITKQGRNLSTGNLNWSTYIQASPSDIIQFQITIQNNSSQAVNNITLRDNLPGNLTYNNALTVDGVTNSGNPSYGLNLGSIGNGQTRTITYQTQIAGPQNFNFGSSTLTNSANVTSTDAGFNSQTASATVAVTRTGNVPTTVSTGWTDSPWAGSFFIPLVLALAGAWAYKSGLVKMPTWAATAMTKSKSISAEQKLQEKIAQIRQKDRHI